MTSRLKFPKTTAQHRSHMDLVWDLVAKALRWRDANVASARQPISSMLANKHFLSVKELGEACDALEKFETTAEEDVAHAERQKADVVKE